jgi:hypothetical protein
MYRELQNIMHTDDNWDGGVAGMHYSSGECDDLKEELVKFMTRYVELERIYAPDIEDEMIDVTMGPEGYGSPYSDQNYLDAARTVEADAAFRNYWRQPPKGEDEANIMFHRKAGAANEYVCTFMVRDNRNTPHTMTVEFEPGTPNVVHIDVQPIEEIQISAEGHGAFCD